MLMHPRFRSRHYERVRLAKTLIDRSYDSPITLEQVSREAGFSPFHFIRLFRVVYKQTPHQYIVQCRIERAKALLSSSKLSIRTICFEVGFESLGSFSTLFRKVTGLSPAAYRKSASASIKPGYIPLCYVIKHGVDQALEE